MVLIRDLRFLARQHLRQVLRIDEGNETLLDDRVERDNFRAAFFRIFQRMQKAWAVGAGILAEKEESICLRQIVQYHRSHRRTNNLSQTHRSGLVAHVGTLGEVVCAVLARQQGVQVGRFQPGMT